MFAFYFTYLEPTKTHNSTETTLPEINPFPADETVFAIR